MSSEEVMSSKLRFFSQISYVTGLLRWSVIRRKILSAPQKYLGGKVGRGVIVEKHYLKEENT